MAATRAVDMRLAMELAALIDGTLSHAQHSPSLYPPGTSDGSLQMCSCGFMGGTQYAMPLHRAIEFIKSRAVAE